MTSSPRWLSRYQQGQREQVWQELHQLGGTVRDSEWAPEAQLVCDEMARRARQNIELIVERLSTDGYRFHDNDDEQTPARPHTPPTAAASAHADWLEQRFRAVPMTVLSWVRIVGDVWLVGTHPEWETSAAADPLVIELEGSRYPAEPPIRDYFNDEWTSWQEQKAEDPDGCGLFVLPAAPDRLHKDNTSGGGLFDLDNTLIDRAASFRRWATHFAEVHSLGPRMWPGWSPPMRTATPPGTPLSPRSSSDMPCPARLTSCWTTTARRS